MQYHQPTEKSTSRITKVYSKQLSYAGQEVAGDYLSDSVIKEVDKTCRPTYLWGSFEDKKKIKLIVWDKVCVPKKFGGLNIKGSNLWNVASVEATYVLTTNGKYSLGESYDSLLGGPE
ncbi:hypothetical protein H5410_041206 [Solanum commersonii]|uniref:Uncharacterized protein n=1 Tax=Solanum commersonii TaxID=4109 RepID=A0A9J5XTU9_SOLCO|nr:hypothetical protein H5410_041206 [Solanum commersonii]